MRISVGAVIVVFLAYLWLVWRGAPWLDGIRLRELTASGQESAVDAIRGRLIQIGAGVVASAALIYTGLNYRLARESHVTDRYMKAIEQLGSERLDVRLGAIYALERIMLDSVRDHSTAGAYEPDQGKRGGKEGPRRWTVGRSYESHDRQPGAPEAA